VLSTGARWVANGLARASMLDINHSTGVITVALVLPLKKRSILTQRVSTQAGKEAL
jgi:hypothetical protein